MTDYRILRTHRNVEHTLVRRPNRFIVVGCAEMELYAAIFIFLGKVSCQKTIRSSHHPVYQAERCQKGWRRRFVDLHIHNIRRDLERLLVVRKATHDQYATTPENHHVIEKLRIYLKSRKAFRAGGLFFEFCRLFILNGGQRRDRTADAGLFRA